METGMNTPSKASALINALVPDYDISTSLGRFRAVQNGLAGSDFKQLATVVGGASIFAHVLHTDSNDLDRYFNSSKLPMSATDSVIDTLKIYMQAADAFGSIELGNEWMSTSVVALAGEKPEDLLDTQAGREVVSEALRKIEYGEFS